MKIKLSVFSCNIEDYSELPQCFQKLEAKVNADHTSYFMQLRNHTQWQARYMLQRITTMEEPWLGLNQFFVDRKAASTTITAKVWHFKIPAYQH